ncbi:SMI1/KNR4 family protein [Marinagarivorans algicola]|uniref:SMI1/KNR4 family protein n=1 Tax=Marinagarivorans algicola TaxID=1513270 RepID=UPI0006B9BB07|nr:SMI1/KNR4 family protein [Marinagarivorans algicola]
MMPFQRLLDLMISNDIAQLGDFVGVPSTEIQAMELHFNLQFPTAYRAFLGACGRSAGHLAGWSSIYFDDLKEIAEEFDFHWTTFKSGQPCADSPLPPQALLIAHYDSHFDYLICDASDTAIYRLSFNDTCISTYTFSDSFETYMESMILAAADSSGQIAPFFIDECGNMIKDDLCIIAPEVE